MVIKLTNNRILELNGICVMGILNVTPDSFSDGGAYPSVNDAIKAAGRMLEEGASIIDLGGESTRPGHINVSLEEEERRVLPVVKALRDAFKEIVISIDTTKARVAEKSLELGAAIINDVSACEAEEEAMLEVIGKYKCGCILMDSKSYSAEICINDVADYLRGRMEFISRQCGLDNEHFVVDPGIGFGKTQVQNESLAVASNRIKEICGRPVLIGLSRKSFLGNIVRRDVSHRGNATTAALTLAAANGADILRVHDVSAASDVVEIVDRIHSKVKEY